MLLGGRARELDAETLGTYLALCVFCLEVDPLRGDGGIPYRRLMGLWNGLHGRGLVPVAWSRSIYGQCRTFLDAHDVLPITDRHYRPDRSMRYGKGEWFPGAWRNQQADEDVVPTQPPTGRRFRVRLAEAGAEPDLIERIVARMTKLNDHIRAETAGLGPGFEVGHSFFCPQGTEEELDLGWYRAVVEGEIAPLLREYWFDDPARAEGYVAELLA